MVKRNSAGLLVYRILDNVPEVLLVHPGGPFFVNKDAGAWTIPKGEPEEDEDLLAAARREFTEETGAVVDGDFIPMESVTQKKWQGCICLGRRKFWRSCSWVLQYILHRMATSFRCAGPISRGRQS